MNVLFSDAVLMRSLILFLIFGSVAGLLAGAALLLRPGWLLGVGKITNRWISTRQMTRLLVQSFCLDGWLYRYNRCSGAALLIGSVYILYFFTAVFDKLASINIVFMFASISPAAMSGLIDALVLTCITGAVFVAIVSLFLLFRPSMLREFEQQANQKISVRQGLKPLEIQRDGLDQYVFRNARPVGVIILLCSIYILVELVSNLKSI